MPALLGENKYQPSWTVWMTKGQWLILCPKTKAPKHSIFAQWLYFPVLSTQHGIRNLQVGKESWQSSGHGYSPPDLAQPFASNLRWGGYQTKWNRALQASRGSLRKRFHLSVILLCIPMASPGYHSVDAFTLQAFAAISAEAQAFSTLKLRFFRLSGLFCTYLQQSPLCTYLLLQFVRIISEFNSIFIFSHFDPNRNDPPKFKYKMPGIISTLRMKCGYGSVDVQKLS